MNDVMTEQSEHAQQTRRARRAAIILALVAVAMYAGFIIATGMKN